MTQHPSAPSGLHAQPGAHHHDVLVVGGGLAGCAAALILAGAGRRVALVERDREPRHKVCGEFLSGEALDLLSVLGLHPATLGAVPIRRVRLCAGARSGAADLPFPAMALTRRCLDAALLQAAEEAGAHVLRGQAVESLQRREGCWQAELAGGGTLSAPDAVLATGKHDLRGLPRPAGVQGNLVALKMYLRLAPPQAVALAGHVELLLYPGGYAGLMPVEGGVANLCALVRRSQLSSFQDRWHGLLAHIEAASSHSRERLAGAQPLLDKPLAVAPIPYGFLRTSAAGHRLWAVGDQAAVIPSFTGDGMSIALCSGVRAAQSLLRGDLAATFQRALGRDLRFQVARATALSRALIHEPSRHVLLAAVRLWPGWLRTVARSTRLPATALPTPHATPTSP